MQGSSTGHSERSLYCRIQFRSCFIASCCGGSSIIEYDVGCSYYLHTLLLRLILYLAEEDALMRFFGNSYVEYRTRVGTKMPFVPLDIFKFFYLSMTKSHLGNNAYSLIACIAHRYVCEKQRRCGANRGHAIILGSM